MQQDYYDDTLIKFQELLKKVGFSQ